MSNQTLNDAVQINENESKKVFFFRIPLLASNLYYFYNKISTGILYEKELEGIIDENYDFEKNVQIYPASNYPNSLFSPDLNLWKGYELICIAFLKKN